MVQITVAFMIILGYVVSMGMEEAHNLAEESERHRRGKAALESIVAGLSTTDVGEERRGRVKAQREQQLERLLRIWAQVRVERKLYELLKVFEHAELIPLSDDLRSLPTGRRSRDLTREIDRVFVAGDARVASLEVFRLMKWVLSKAGYNLASQSDVALTDDLTPEAIALHFDGRAPTVDSLRMLKLQIVNDLYEDRESLVELQYALVGKVAATRLDRLAEMPIEPGPQVETEDLDLGLAMLDQVLEDLRKGMRLLPEVIVRIRGTREQVPDSGQD